MSSPQSQKAESKLAAQAARTRTLLIDTTLQLLLEHDFHRLSLDAIAAKAGVTKGAIYGHFENKEALLSAALATQPSARPDTLVWPPHKGTVKQRLRRLGEMVLAQQGDTGPAATRSAEYLLYALTHDALRSQTAAVFAKTRQGMEANIRALFDPDEIAMPVEALALLLGGMIMPGLMFTRAFTGNKLDRETVLAIFEGLAA